MNYDPQRGVMRPAQRMSEAAEAPTLKDFGRTLIHLVCALILLGGLVISVLVSCGLLVFHSRHWLATVLLVVTLAGVRGWSAYNKLRDSI